MEIKLKDLKLCIIGLGYVGLPLAVEFGKKMKIDLRSLPTSFLCLTKRSLDESKNRESSRVIGRPRFYKGFGKFLVCDERGVSEVKLLERTHREVFKEGKKDVFENYLRRRE